MSGVSAESLASLYRDTEDPWNHRSSDYEHIKHAATIAALARPRYRSILEIGCGNGELARQLVMRTEYYDGIDAVERALTAARRVVPTGVFHRLFLPVALPDGTYDLVVLSEVLYFLDRPAIVLLALELSTRWPDAELLVVNWLGPTGHELSGNEACAAFLDSLQMNYVIAPVAVTADYRIDRLSRSSNALPA